MSTSILPTVESVPDLRIHALNTGDIATGGDYVLYWMTAARRFNYNYALQRAVELANELDKPLVILDALRLGYPWASARFHYFIIEGMHDLAAIDQPATYLNFIESHTQSDADDALRSSGSGRGLLEALSTRACAIIGDDFPCFFLPKMHAAVAPRLGPRFEVVDANGWIPMRATDKVHTTAYSYRRWIQKNIREHLYLPLGNPLARLKNTQAPDLGEIQKRWQFSTPGDWLTPPATTSKEIAPTPCSIEALDIDQQVVRAELVGGCSAADERCTRFIARLLGDYQVNRNHPDLDATSGLSPYLHFGHISSQQIVLEIMRAEDWHVDDLGLEAKGKREGFWGMSPSAEAFMDQVITWRELGYNFCHHRPDDYDQYSSLPEWAKTTLAEHRGDPRTEGYDLARLEHAQTGDPIWNAAQRQLVQTGVMNNYLRMLWAKKILQWTPSPEEALERAIHLNNKYSLDGRNPNSYSGVFWTFGRYDRAWGPERPIFGKIRYMTSDSTKRKLKMSEFLATYGTHKPTDQISLF